MEKFPHLKFLQKIAGKPRYNGGGKSKEQSKQNKANRAGHSGYLFGRTTEIKDGWDHRMQRREELHLAPLDPDVIPVFLKVNPSMVGYGFDLKEFGIEIISEEDNGYIVGASLDAFRSLNEKIDEFLRKKHGSAKIAEFWEIVQGRQWKPEHVLSDYLLSLWKNKEINDDEVYKLEIGIAFDKPLNTPPDPEKRGYELKLEKYREERIERDRLYDLRQEEFEKFISHYGGITSSIIDLEDSFCCEVEITGLGLKDLVLNYPFVFEISETEIVNGVESEVEEGETIEFEIIAPEPHFPEIAVIDSGIMEGHKYISPAIIQENSKSYIEDNTSTADFVKNGGHGTRVAGAILYPTGITNIQSAYQLPCFVRNLRVLNDDNKLTHKFPAELMKQIVEDNNDCKVFNLSINSSSPSRLKHMSSWAATIDSLINQNQVLFLISAGNISRDDIRHYVGAGKRYPDFLDEPYCRIANPAQSSFAIAVGSVNQADFDDNDFKSLGSVDEISPFSRIGTGIWGMIKPDVVEYGGGLVASKVGNIITSKKSISPDLLRSTLHGGSAFGKDVVGTSFATPKVSYIVAQLLRLYPDEDVNLLRALVVQGARLPNDFFRNPTSKSVKHLGYGIPSLERVTRNTNQRVTFYNTGSISAEEGHIYSLKIPEFLRSPAEEYDILIEVTLSYTAKVRRTRQKTKSYLSTWLDWKSSKVGETFENFKEYVLKKIEGRETAYDKQIRNGMPSWKWKIKSDKRGVVEDISRTNSTIQKDWAIVKSHELDEDISFAVRGHKGWDRSMEPISYSLVMSIEILNSNVEIYEAIRIENEIEIET